MLNLIGIDWLVCNLSIDFVLNFDVVSLRNDVCDVWVISLVGSLIGLHLDILLDIFCAESASNPIRIVGAVEDT